MTDVICPLCGKPNPPDRDECRFCLAPLKSGGFIAPSGQEGEAIPPPPPPEKPAARGKTTSSLEQAIPDWLRETEANFLEPTESAPEGGEPSPVSEQIDSLINQPVTPSGEKEPAIDDDWLASLLEEAGISDPSKPSSRMEAGEGQEQADETGYASSSTEEMAEEEQAQPSEQVEKPAWLSALEASSTIKMEDQPPVVVPPAGHTPAATAAETELPPELEIPDWIGQANPEESPPPSEETETPIAPAELPGWLEALRPAEEVAPTGPVEDLTSGDVVSAGPLVGLRGVISAHPSAIRARKPPTYSIKLRVTEEQSARVEMMEELLANEQKPKPLPSQHVITYQNVSRLVIALVLLLPIIWMIITGSQRIPPPQPGEVLGVVDFTQQVQAIPVGAPVLVAFDYEAGFSGEMNLAVSTMLSQLMIKNIFLTLATTTPSGPALAESLFDSVSASSGGAGAPNGNYTNLGYIPGGVLGLQSLVDSPSAVLPYSLDGNNVWVTSPLNAISTVSDFSAVIVLTNEPSIARSWIEQVGPALRQDGTPLLIVTSSQAEPLLRPYYEAVPSQVQGLVAGLVGGLALARTVGSLQQNGVWDAFSIGITVSVVIILAGSIIGVVYQMRTTGAKKED